MKPPQLAEGKGQDGRQMLSACREPRLQGGITLAARKVGYRSRRLSEEGLVSIAGLLPILSERPFPVFLGLHAAHS